MDTPLKLSEEDLTSHIDDILSSNLYLEDVPYSMEDHAQQVSYQSRQDAAREIVEYLKKNNLLNLK